MVKVVSLAVEGFDEVLFYLQYLQIHLSVKHVVVEVCIFYFFLLFFVLQVHFMQKQPTDPTHLTFDIQKSAVFI